MTTTGRISKLAITITILAVSMLFAGPLAAQDDSNEVVKAELKKLSFFVGEWKTDSTLVPSGKKAPGELSYKYVLGDTYLLLRFVGSHPEKPVWEACKMITWDAGLGAFVAYTFPTPEGPVRYIGRWTADDTITYTREEPYPDGSLDRISYTRKPDGTIFQLNEATDADGNWQPRLRTQYTRK